MSAAGRAPPAATDDGAALRLLWRAWWVCNLLTLFVRSFLGAVCGFAISFVGYPSGTYAHSCPPSRDTGREARSASEGSPSRSPSGGAAAAMPSRPRPSRPRPSQQQLPPSLFSSKVREGKEREGVSL